MQLEDVLGRKNLPQKTAVAPPIKKKSLRAPQLVT